jgi:hypothetical protein
MVDAAVRLLSLANQLVAQGQHIIFKFEGLCHKAMSYLNRANFFSCLSPQVCVKPERPNPLYAAHFQGHNQHLVEFKPISSTDRDASLLIPSQFKNALKSATSTRSDCKQLCNTAYTLFGELIDNIYLHSQTKLDGFAALQVYPRGGKVCVVVSDSGIGLLETLKPKLLTPSTQSLTDPEIIALLFNGNISWEENGGGAGLKSCADLAHRHGSTVNIRLQNCSVSLYPAQKGYQTGNILGLTNLPFLKGTHLCFSIPLDFPK